MYFVKDFVEFLVLYGFDIMMKGNVLNVYGEVLIFLRFVVYVGDEWSIKLWIYCFGSKIEMI